MFPELSTFPLTDSCCTKFNFTEALKKRKRLSTDKMYTKKQVYFVNSLYIFILKLTANRENIEDETSFSVTCQKTGMGICLSLQWNKENNHMMR